MYWELSHIEFSTYYMYPMDRISSDLGKNMSALVCVYVWIVKYDEDRWVVNYALSVSLVTSCVVVFHFTIFHYLNQAGGQCYCWRV